LGNAGQINIEVSEAVTMLNGAYIGSNTYSIGNAGDIKLSADELLINGIGSIYSTGFFSDADSDSNGNAGTISLHIVNQLHMEQALISSNALINSKGNGGQINVDVGGLFSVSNDSVVNSNTFSSGDAGSININAANLQLTKGGEIASYTYAQGNAGSINITTLDLTADAQASSSLTGILSDAQPNSTGNAGSINISADKSITVTNGGRISSTTYAVGNAGNIDIQSPQVLVSHNEAINRTGILSNAEIGSTGNAGTIKMIVSDLLKVSNIGTISSDTYAVGDAGSIDIVTGQLYLSGTGEVYRTGISSNAEVNSSGNAGSVKVTISDLAEIFNGARISSSTFGQGNAGNLEVNASTMSLDGSDSIFSSGIFTTAYENSIGHAGQINVDVSGNLNILANANIASNTYAHGNAGSVEVHAGDLLIDSQIPGLFSGIGTETRLDASGDAGNIKVVVDGELDILHDGNISSISNTPGNAGNISIETDKLHINAANSQFFNISSAAYQNSSGEVGNIDIVANKIHLDNNAEISIAAYGNVSNITSEQLHHIFVTSNELIFNNGAFITALSGGNAPAGAISIITQGNLELQNLSTITTLSAVSNGGPININSGLIYLDNSLVSTSVHGEQGNGGNIDLSTPALLMKSGFIQANTAASGASGGDIMINTSQLIIPSNQEFLTNQDERIAFESNSQKNVIQAAAPDGLSGTVSISAPVLDISASILNINSGLGNVPKVGKNPCRIAPGALPSSLTWSGQGGFPTPLSDSISLPLGSRAVLESGKKAKNHLYEQVHLNKIYPINTIQPGC